MTVDFEVESAFEAGGRAYVFARALKPSISFGLGPDSTLKGCRIEQWLSAPRALDAQGKQRTDLFSFCLRTKAELINFTVGDRVALAQASVEPSR